MKPKTYRSILITKLGEKLSHYPHKQACGNKPPPVQGIPRVTASEGESRASRDI